MWRSITTLLGLALTVSAGTSKQCPAADRCFSLNIPDSSLSAASGDLYLQVTAPTNDSWIGVAQGVEMAHAHFFVVYTSGDGRNVTLSPRLADGHSMPLFSPDTQIELLDGSGVKNGIMTANIKCKNCSSWNDGTMDLKAESTSWIWAYLSGDPINTDDISAQIRKHDVHGTLTFDATAHGGPNSNPFLGQATPTSPATPTSTSGHSSHGGATARHGPPKRIVRMYVAHGVMACLAWAGIFPIGGIMIRLLSFRNLVWVHAGLQIFGFCLYTAAVGLGIELSINPRFWRMNNKHVIIGLTIFALFFIQGFTGFLHHTILKKSKGQRSVWSHLHLWSGRLCIPLGMMNAGFGFQITHKGLDTWEVKTYIVFAVLVWVAYVVSAAVGEVRKRKERTDEAFRVLRAGDSGHNSRTGSGSEAPMTEQVVPNKLPGDEHTNEVSPEVRYEVKA